jgi:hypothetical protein
MKIERVSTFFFIFTLGTCIKISSISESRNREGEGVIPEDLNEEI